MSTYDHYAFDMNSWISEFSLEKVNYGRMSFFGPDYICLTELLRREIDESIEVERSERWASDVFVLGLGEGPLRHGTKVGGLPYISKDEKWPISIRTGAPLTFVCQFRFDESTDLVGNLPGDVLLVFCEMSDRYQDNIEWNFMWSSVGLHEADLITRNDIPSSNSPECLTVPSCYGVRVRYFDLLDASNLDAMFDVLNRSPKFRRFFKNWSITDVLNFIRSWACQMCTLKIGGIPYWARPIEALVETRNAGKFLALIPPLWPDAKTRNSWLNQTTASHVNSLFWPPEGCIHLYLNKDEQVIARFASLEPW